MTSIHLWSYSAFLGMRVGRLRLIFKLPERVSPLLRTIPSWPTYPLAYVEWYRMSHHPGSHHNMYTITSLKPPQSAPRHSKLIQISPGEVVPLKTIRQSCQLIPLADPGECWPAEWTSTTVLDRCSTFLLNNWASKFAYQTIW